MCCSVVRRRVLRRVLPGWVGLPGVFSAYGWSLSHWFDAYRRGLRLDEAVPGVTRFRGGAWPRDAAVDTHKQAGRQSTALTRASSCSCNVTKRFRILATLKQRNRSMYSNTSGYVHMG